MGFAGLAVLLFCLVFIFANIWLISLAYKQSRLWGLAVFFFSPLSAIVFARKHWQVAKKPFLVYVTSFCLAIGMTMLMANSLIDVQLSKMIQQTDLSENVGPLQKQMLTKEALENLDTVEGGLKSISQQSIDGDEQKFIRLISEYVHYKKGGFTDRSRRYIMRNVRELLLLPGLDSGQRTRLLEIKQDLEGKKEEGMSVLSLASLQPTEQMTLAVKSPALNDASPPPPFLTEALGLSKEKKHRVTSFGERTSLEIKAEHLQRKTKMTENLSSVKRISFRQAKHYIGSQISFINLSGSVQKCFLVGFSSAGLECEKRFQSGTFSTRYRRSEVKSLRVFRN